jgi:hypothetical protein
MGASRGRAIARKYPERRPPSMSPKNEQLTKVFASFFKKKRFFLFFFEKKNQKTFVHLAFLFCAKRSTRVFYQENSKCDSPAPRGQCAR